jgi:hypothetical protein
VRERAEIKFFFNLEPTKRYLESTKEITGTNTHAFPFGTTLARPASHNSAPHSLNPYGYPLGREFTEMVCQNLKKEPGSIVVFTVNDNGWSTGCLIFVVSLR